MCFFISLIPHYTPQQSFLGHPQSVLIPHMESPINVDLQIKLQFCVFLYYVRKNYIVVVVVDLIAISKDGRWRKLE
jgi:hypothetical protein